MVGWQPGCHWLSGLYHCPIKSSWMNRITIHYMFWTFGTPKEEYKLEMSNLRIIQAYCFIAPDAIHGPEVKAASGELVKK